MNKSNSKKSISFPKNGTDRATLMNEMKLMKADDLNWKEGRSFSYVYYAGDEILDTVKEAYQLFFSENALNPSIFPSLQKMEVEVVEMVGDLLNGDELVAGSMTSGGTESILMTMKTAREWAKKRNITNPEVIVPTTAHPAFHKACYYFGMIAKVVEVGEDFRAIPGEMELQINENTVMLVASAPSYPQGVIDPVEAIAAIAKKRNLLCHVDACVGGFVLPFLKELNYPIPAFDFSVDGVTSISADIHKFGYAAKGASIILYKNPGLRKHQFYSYTQWPGGIYGSPSMAGTRPGGPIAAAWAALKFVGMSGYCEKTKICIETTHKLKKAIEAFPELKILSNPDMNILCMASDELDIYELGDELGILGWTIDRQQLPPSLHLTITPAHQHVIEDFVKDLAIAVQKAKQLSMNKLSKVIQVGAVKSMKKILPESLMGRFQSFASKHSKVGGKRSAAMYGMMGELQDTGNLDEMVIDFLDKLTRNQN